jgi:hypothetical protein
MSIRYFVSPIALFPASLYNPMSLLMAKNCNSASLPLWYGRKRKARIWDVVAIWH